MTPISSEVATNQQVCEALVVLDDLTPVDFSKDKSPLEAWMDRLAYRAMAIAAVALIFLMILFGIDRSFGLSKAWSPWVLALGIVVVGTPQAAWIMQMVPTVWTLLRFRKSASRMRQASLRHDIDAAQKLHRFPAVVLRILDDWLQQHDSRQQARLAMFFGGSDKVALLLITVFGLTLLRQFSGAFEDFQKVIPGLSAGTWHWILFGFYLVLAGVAGLSIGGWTLRLVIDRTAYQRDLLKLALDAHERRARSRQGRTDASSGRQVR